MSIPTGPASEPADDDDNTAYWCLQTMKSFGPDDEWSAAGSAATDRELATSRYENATQMANSFTISLDRKQIEWHSRCVVLLTKRDDKLITILALGSRSRGDLSNGRRARHCQEEESGREEGRKGKAVKAAPLPCENRGEDRQEVRSFAAQFRFFRSRGRAALRAARPRLQCVSIIR